VTSRQQQPIVPDRAALLLRTAAAAAANAHCPYSHYPVGAALLDKDGAVHVGCNVENASYGLTICAERAAICRAVAAGAREFQALAIVAGGPDMPFPCGACRQVFAEFCPADLPVHLGVADRLGEARTLTLGELLPHPFSLSNPET
jgi:cytidine deaminase